MNNVEYGQILAAYILSKLRKNITHDMALKKIRKSGIVSKIDPGIKYGSCDIECYLKHGEYNNTVLKFHQLLNSKLAHCKSTAFYKNIRTLNFHEIDFPSMMKSYDAIYDCDENDVSVNTAKKSNAKKEYIINHELLHMASTYKKGIVVLMGFAQSLSKGHWFGNGLNEGYTERLNLKYLSKEKDDKAFFEERFISEGIENIVGTKRMEELYFSADLKGLIEELSKYCSKEQATALIRKIDECHDRYNVDEMRYSRLAAQIRVEIANIYATKQKKLLDSKEITQEQYEDNIIKNGAFYVKGYRLEKLIDGYGYRERNEKIGWSLSKSDYKKIKEDYLATKIERTPIFSDSEFIISDGDIINSARNRWYQSLQNDVSKNHNKKEAYYKINEVIEDTETLTPSTKELNDMFNNQDVSPTENNSNKK